MGGVEAAAIKAVVATLLNVVVAVSSVEIVEEILAVVEGRKAEVR